MSHTNKPYASRCLKYGWIQPRKTRAVIDERESNNKHLAHGMTTESTLDSVLHDITDCMFISTLTSGVAVQHVTVGCCEHCYYLNYWDTAQRWTVTMSVELMLHNSGSPE